MTKQSSLAKNTAKLRPLAILATEINAHFVTIKSGDDARLQAAMKLARAKALCGTGGLDFKAWCEENVPQSWETIRKLVAIGEKENPAEALAETRERNARANASKRERDAEEEEANPRPNLPGALHHIPAKGAKQPATPLDDVRRMFTGYSRDLALTVLRSLAKEYGFKLVAIALPTAPESLRAEDEIEAARKKPDQAAIKAALAKVRSGEAFKAEAGNA